MGHWSSKEQLRYPKFPFILKASLVSKRHEVSQQHPLPLPWQHKCHTGSGPLLPGATMMEGPVCLAPRPPSSCASSSSSSPCRAGPCVSSLGSHPVPQAGHSSPPGLQAVPSDRPGTGRRSGERSRLCTLTGRIKALHTHREDLRDALGVTTPTVCQERWEQDKELSANQGLRGFPATATPQITREQHQPSPPAQPCLPHPTRACSQPGIPSQGKGYNHIQGQHTQAAHQPGQVVQDVITLALAWLRVLQEDTEAIQGIPQHHQGKERVGDSTGGFPLVLGKEGEQRSLGAALLNLSTTINHPLPQH